MTEPPPVTVLGLGLMGRALAAAFLRAGHPTTVWNRTPDKAADLLARGAHQAATPRDTTGALVVVCVTDHAAVHEVLDQVDLAGRILVNLTSGTSAQARATAERVAAEGGSYLDGAILADPAGIGTPDAVILHSGPRTAFDDVVPALASLGTATYLGEDHGLSALHDAAVLGLMWSILNGFLHGAALLGTAGVPATAFAPLAVRSVGTVAGWLADTAGQIDDGTYPAPDATIDTHLAAMEHLVEESGSAGISTALPTFVKALAARAASNGHGGSGYAALIDQFRTEAPA